MESGGCHLKKILRASSEKRRSATSVVAVAGSFLRAGHLPRKSSAVVNPYSVTEADESSMVA